VVPLHRRLKSYVAVAVDGRADASNAAVFERRACVQGASSPGGDDVFPDAAVK
jgi:hypothetical protein